MAKYDLFKVFSAPEGRCPCEHGVIVFGNRVIEFERGRAGRGNDMRNQSAKSESFVMKGSCSVCSCLIRLSKRIPSLGFEFSEVKGIFY
jgi:hypothetical protein